MLHCVVSKALYFNSEMFLLYTILLHFLLLLKAKQIALRFTPVSFIELQITDSYHSNRSDTAGLSSAKHTICWWIKQVQESAQQVLFSYSETGKKYPGLVLGVDSYHGNLSGVEVGLKLQKVLPTGEWHHICWCWSEEKRKLVVYLDGEESASKDTGSNGVDVGEDSVRDGVVRLGGVFSGDLFKFNIFNSVLNTSEIGIIASNFCSDSELLDKLNFKTSVLGWEDILPRKGGIEEVSAGCEDEEVRELRELLRRTKLELAETKLNLTNVLEEQKGGKIYKTCIA